METAGEVLLDGEDERAATTRLLPGLRFRGAGEIALFLVFFCHGSIIPVVLKGYHPVPTDEQVLTDVIYLIDMKRVYLVFSIAMVFALVFTTLGCNSTMEGYRTFTFNKVAHFSFEYPAHYEKYAAIYNEDLDDRGISIGFNDKVPSKGSTNGFIEVLAEGAGITYPDATAALEDTLSGFVEPDYYDEDAEEEPKRLLERSTITVAGIPAELIVYSYGYDLIREESSDSSVILIRIAREVYFDHDDLIWNLVIESDEDRADVAEADFEHLLETFQILD